MKKFLCFILTCVLLTFINLFLVSISIDKIIIKNIPTDQIKQLVSDALLGGILGEDESLGGNDEITNILKNNEGINNIINKSTNYLIDSIVYNKDEDFKISEDDINSIIKEVKGTLIKEYTSEASIEDILKSQGMTQEEITRYKSLLTDEQIKEMIDEFNEKNESINDNEINNMFNTKELASEFEKAVIEIKNSVTSVAGLYLVIFSRLVSTGFKLILLGGIILIILLIALLKSSWYKWMINFSIVGIMAGISNGLLVPIIIKTAVNTLIKSANLNISLNLNLSSLTTPSLILLVASIILLIVYIILKKNDFEYNYEETEEVS